MNGRSESSAKATVHGVYDAMLGGAEHLHADRELAKAITERFPSVPSHVRAAREFHLRASRWCAEQGVSRFIGTGVASWKPGISNVHDAAREVIPEAGAVYVHRGADAHARARAMLAGAGLCSVRARVDFPDEVLSAAAVAEMLAGGRPACLHLAMTLHFAAAKEAGEQVARYAGALPPGSVLAVSVSLPDRSRGADELLAMFTPAKVCRHTAGDVRGWLEDAGLKLAVPGLCDVVRLAPGRGWAAGLPPGAPGLTVGALGVKP